MTHTATFLLALLVAFLIACWTAANLWLWNQIAPGQDWGVAGFFFTSVIVPGLMAVAWLDFTDRR